tara:strand:+ start:81 stop:395 length:315 start_codon:yes stop_codon:yes gene_type:complete
MSEIESATVTVAVLDNTGVFMGVETIPESAAGSRVQVPADIDLKIGGYKWQADDGRFMPIAGQYPSQERALYDLAKALADAGVLPVVPSALASWMSTTAKKQGW